MWELTCHLQDCLWGCMIEQSGYAGNMRIERSGYAGNMRIGRSGYAGNMRDAALHRLHLYII
jgi:hypothetical protein